MSIESEFTGSVQEVRERFAAERIEIEGLQRRAMAEIRWHEDNRHKELKRCLLSLRRLYPLCVSHILAFYYDGQLNPVAREQIEAARHPEFEWNPR